MHGCTCWGYVSYNQLRLYILCTTGKAKRGELRRRQNDLVTWQRFLCSPYTIVRPPPGYYGKNNCPQLPLDKPLFLVLCSPFCRAACPTCPREGAGVRTTEGLMMRECARTILENDIKDSGYGKDAEAEKGGVIEYNNCQRRTKMHILLPRLLSKWRLWLPEFERAQRSCPA